MMRPLTFIIPDNIDLLERAGVNIVRFSPLHDRALPDCQMIWLGGGYPELYAADSGGKYGDVKTFAGQRISAAWRFTRSVVV
ncbi:cobyrinic acid A,C-diamide synthase [Salmonella enterica subsp. enterica]|uniref:Cobyrinic acid A,C-diamide synthase n=1 Tax=Salmonella enterica I TaxID=59201 RepID=A0A379WS87_SALET|nr:cobyrinic acid A,C-diamide synthase [Salmonella enterica subsp. enterica]